MAEMNIAKRFKFDGIVSSLPRYFKIKSLLYMELVAGKQIGVFSKVSYGNEKGNGGDTHRASTQPFA